MVVVFGFEGEILFPEDKRGKAGLNGFLQVIEIKIPDSLVLIPHEVFEFRLFKILYS